MLVFIKCLYKIKLKMYKAQDFYMKWIQKKKQKINTNNIYFVFSLLFFFFVLNQI